MLSLDVSGSMLARDFEPDRLGAAKEVASNFIVDRPNDRIGLVVFAGESFTQCPLTTDKRSLLNLLGDVRPEKALVLGTGGASKAVKYVLEQLGIAFDAVSRDGKNGAYTYGDLSEEIVRAHRLIVNATPLGTFPNAEGCPVLPYEALGAGHFLFDLVYNPAVTEFLKRGAAQGAATRNGYDMLVGQAEKAWEIWNE